MSRSCRLCLTEDSEAYSKIETEHCLKQLKSVVPEIDLTLTEGPVICTKCSNSLFDAYTFKLNCLLIEKKLQFSLNESQCKREYQFEHISEDEDEIANSISIGQITYDSSEMECTKEEPTVVCGELQDSTYSSIPEDDPATQDSLNENTDSKFLCKFCGSRLANYREWINHTEVHTRNNNSCGICDKSFETQEQFLTHRDTHLLNKCLLCGQDFFDKSTFSKHMKEQHTGEQHPGYPNFTTGKFECDVCGLKIKRKRNLVAHIRTHTGERPYKCTICNKAFAQSGTLSGHIKSIHLSERPHHCQICGKGFPVRGAFTAHMKIHGNLLNNFICHHCGKAFILQCRLKRHMRRHNPQKTIVCHVCNKSFADKHSLEPHMRIHTGEKPFECTICLKKFTRQYSMRIHFRSCAKRSRCTKTEQKLTK